MKTLWTIVIVIVVVGVVGFGGYKVWHHFNKQPAAMTQTAMTTQPTKAMSPSMAMTSKNTVYMMAPAGKLGTILTDPKGMTLYTYTKDTKGVSTCTGGCLQAWPAYVAKSETGKFPANISVIKRSDGTLQYAWNGMPLYYFTSDKKPGDTTGQGVGGVWNVVKQ